MSDTKAIICKYADRTAYKIFIFRRDLKKCLAESKGTTVKAAISGLPEPHRTNYRGAEVQFRNY